MNKNEQMYLDALASVLENGDTREDRTGVGTISRFDLAPIVYDLEKSFPLLTTKKMFFKGIVEELLWFLRGSTNVNELQERGVHIWDQWADEQGDLGPVYGKQWRRWRRAPLRHVVGAHEWNSNPPPIDQIDLLIKGLILNPTSRRHIVSAWNVGEVELMALPPCHMMFQCYVREGKYLDLKFYQRSADMFLGVPFNIASYATLAHLLAIRTELAVGKLIHVIGDAHIYSNHVEQVQEQLARTPSAELPQLIIHDNCDPMTNPVSDFSNLTFEDFELINYEAQDAIKAPVAV